MRRRRRGRHASTPLPGCSYHADFLTVDEQDALVEAIKARLKGTGYERDHWDAVIDRYREREMLSVDDELAEAAVERRARPFLRREQGVTSRFLPPHCIDLAADGGVIRPHIDSIKFSGRVVAGLVVGVGRDDGLGGGRPGDGRAAAGRARERAAPRAGLALRHRGRGALRLRARHHARGPEVVARPAGRAGGLRTADAVGRPVLSWFRGIGAQAAWDEHFSASAVQASLRASPAAAEGPRHAVPRHDHAPPRCRRDCVRADGLDDRRASLGNRQTAFQSATAALPGRA